MSDLRSENKQDLSREAIKRAYKKGTILEWDKSVALDDYVLSVAIETLGKRKFVRVLDRWPEEIVAGLKRKLLGSFNSNFSEDGANYQARERYAWIFGDLQTAVFGNKAGEIAYKDSEEARRFADFLIGSFGLIALSRISFQEENLKLLLEHIEYSQIPTAGLVWDIDKKKKARRLAKEIDKRIYKRIITSELWYVDIGKAVSDEIKNELADEDNLEANINILRKYDLERGNIEKLMKIIGEVLIKAIPLENFVGALKNDLESLEEGEVSDVALDFAKERFWPLRGWLEGIEELIRELGGDIPEGDPQNIGEKAKDDSQKFKLKNRGGKEAKTKESQNKKDKKNKKETADTLPESAEKKQENHKKSGEILQVPLSEAQGRFEDIKDQPLSSQPITLKGFDQPVKPTVSNWLSDYKNKMGVGYHDNMQRHNYLFKTENGKKLEESERMIVSAILKSHDERAPLPIDPKKGKIVLSELAARGNTDTQIKEENTDGDTDAQMEERRAATDKVTDTQIEKRAETDGDADAQMQDEGTNVQTDSESTDESRRESFGKEAQSSTEDKDKFQERDARNNQSPPPSQKEAKPNLDGNVVDLREDKQ